MKKIIRMVIAGAAATGLAVGGIALTAGPAEAKINGKGSVTTAEVSRIFKAMNRQKCVTVNETRRIVKGRGEYVGSDEGFRDYVFEGSKRSRLAGAYVSFDSDGCAFAIITWKKGQPDPRLGITLR